MHIIEKTVITEEHDVTKDIICNKCGKSCKGGFDYSSATLYASWGYGSQKDTEEHESDICEPCYDEIISTFKFPPTIKNYMGF